MKEEYDQEYAYESDNPVISWAINLGLVAAGFVGLALGSDWSVESASSIARSLGVSDLIIGLTIIALGTSLPELATSLIASFKGERDIAVGNVVGSNIFNILAVLGVGAMASTTGGVNIPPSALWIDIPIAILVAIACMPIFFTGNMINRFEGGIFVGYYALYSIHLFLKATSSEMLGTYNSIICYGVLPITMIFFAIQVWREMQQGRARMNK